MHVKLDSVQGWIAQPTTGGGSIGREGGC